MEEADLIARFMGTEIKMDMMGNEVPNYKSWNEIMPVCEKIRTLGNIIVDIELGGRVIISFDDGVAFYTKKYCYATKNIEAVYAAVIDFIKFYNNNKID